MKSLISLNKIAFVIIAVLLCAIMAGCSTNHPVMTPTSNSTEENKTEMSDEYTGVYMTLSSVERMENGGKHIKVVWHNGSSDQIMFSEKFNIYLLENDGKLSEVRRSDVSLSDVMYTLPSGKEKSFTYNAEKFDLWLIGNYVLCCEFYGEDGKSFEISLDFTIEKDDSADTRPTIIPLGKFYEYKDIRIGLLGEDKVALALNEHEYGGDNPYHLPIFKFDTYAEFEDFKKDINIHNNFKYEGNKEKVAYDEEFFEEKSLIAVYRIASSGTFTFGVKTVNIDGELFCAYIEQTNDPFIYTDDMAYWLIFVELEKSEIKDCTYFDAIRYYEKNKTVG